MMQCLKSLHKLFFGRGSFLFFQYLKLPGNTDPVLINQGDDMLTGQGIQAYLVKILRSAYKFIIETPIYFRGSPSVGGGKNSFTTFSIYFQGHINFCIILRVYNFYQLAGFGKEAQPGLNGGSVL